MEGVIQMSQNPLEESKAREDYSRVPGFNNPCLIVALICEESSASMITLSPLHLFISFLHSHQDPGEV